jgi:hypothetical protein
MKIEIARHYWKANRKLIQRARTLITLSLLNGKKLFVMGKNLVLFANLSIEPNP